MRRKIKKLPYKKFFKLLEENFCKECEHYNESGNHLWEDFPTCCTLDSFDGCIILYLTGADIEWEYEDEEKKEN